MRLFDYTARKIIVTGHYGSGKTEFSISLAIKLAAQIKDKHNDKLAIVDLDIVNPYFRSREKRELLERKGICVYGSAYETEITAELPAIGATIRTPLEDKDCRVIIDTGGNDAGALILNQFTKYFTDDTIMLAVINANRPDTRTKSGALAHIRAIENTTGMQIDGIVNNTHMLHETTAEMVLMGHFLCAEVCDDIGKMLYCDCYPEQIVDPCDLSEIPHNLMPLGRYMRPSWLDK
ncbi:MAG: ATP-binding protein [Oscillospiraceae bacterium]|nr:ATP-binding protein [Oscillospiraceae bacterium]